MKTASLARTVLIVAILNLAYFGFEFTVALRIESASLLADAADFFEDAAVNGLILLGLGWSASNRARLGKLLAFVLLAPVLAFAWTLWRKWNSSVVPAPDLLSLTGLGALTINLFCAFLLARYRRHGGSLTKTAFLSARNDAIANIGIIGAAAATFLTKSVWPDIVVGCAIACLNIDAAREVLAAARGEKALDSAEA
ncbi:MAG: cation transporter [Phenylobacterium sp.]|uniref:cation transporter n=1 Tax=Phenylobacterium sp. TaxID=1871053 RepID=UPI001A35FA68|nr:cation transporter [Phenylobacterium sp.]MBJ7412161.1 cation transporter [Phenylobacterium sp.]